MGFSNDGLIYLSQKGAHMTESLSGSIQQKNGRYYAVLNYKDETGKRRQKWINTQLPVKNNRRNAERFLRQAMEEFQSQAVIPKSDLFFSDFLVQWAELNKASWAPKTYHGYRNIIEHQLVPYFQDRKLRLQGIKPTHIQGYYQKKLEQDGVKSATVMRHHAILHKALKYAVRIDLIASNPADKVILPKREKFVGAFYSVEEIDALLEAAKGTPLETVILLTVFYGLRRSEATGIRWSSIDFENKTISIENKLVQLPTGDGKTQIVASPTMKTDSSLRTLPLIGKVAEHLKDVHKRQEENKALFGNTYRWKYDGYVCLFDDGGLISPDYVTTRFPRLLDKHGLRKIRFHDLRHSCASLLLSLGFSLKDVQVWLGHNNFSTTADIYAHVDYKSKQALAEKLGETISTTQSASSFENRLENG